MQVTADETAEVEAGEVDEGEPILPRGSILDLFESTHMNPVPKVVWKRMIGKLAACCNCLQRPLSKSDLRVWHNKLKGTAKVPNLFLPEPQFKSVSLLRQLTFG